MDTLLVMGVSNAVLALALALIAFVVSLFRVHPHVAHTLWLLVLLKLVTPPFVNVPTPFVGIEPTAEPVVIAESETASAAFPSAVADAPPARPEEPQVVTPSTVNVHESAVAPEVPSREEASPKVGPPEVTPAEVTPAEVTPAEVATADAASSTASPATSTDIVESAASPTKPTFAWPRVRWTSVLAVLWLAGSAVMFGWVVRGAIRIRSLLRTSAPTSDELARRAAALAEQIGLRSCPRVEVVDAAIPPIVWCPGWVPRIVLPAALVGALDADEVDAVLAHELSHVRRWDHLVRWVEVLAIVAFWWNPVAWYARRRLREAEEACCDAWVVWALPDRRRSYGKALMKTFEFLNDDHRAVPLAGTAFGGALHPKRIEMIVNESVHRRMSPGILVLLLVVSACVLPLQAGPLAKVVEGSGQETEDESGERTEAAELGDETEPDESPEPVAGEPIAPGNADGLHLLLESSRPVNHLERGPGPNELLLNFDDRIEIVDDTTLEVVRTVADEARPGFSFSRDGRKTSWLDGKAVVVRDEKTGAITRIEAAGEEDLGRPVLSPDNKVVVVTDIVVDETGGEGSGSVHLRVFDATAGKLIRKLTIVDGSYGGLTPVFSPDGKTLAVGNRNDVTNLFDTTTWKKRAVLPRRMTHEIAFSPDGETLAAAYTDGTIALWSVETGKILRTADSGCSRVQFLDWSPGGDLLATSGPKGTRIARNAPNEQRPGMVQVWDPRNLELVADLVGVSQSGSVRFTRDGRRLVARFKRDILLPETKVAVWSTSTPMIDARRELAEPDESRKLVEGEPITSDNAARVGLLSVSDRGVESLERSGTDEFVFYKNGSVEVVDATNFEVRHRIPLAGRRNFTFSRDRSKTTWTKGSTAFVRDEKSGKTVEFDVGERPGPVVLSPDNKFVLVGGKRGDEGDWTTVLSVFDAATGQLFKFLVVVGNGYSGLTPVFSPDGRTLVVGCRNHGTRVFDTKDWTRRYTIRKAMTQEIAFSPDGERVAMAYVDGTVAVRDAKTGEAVKMVESGCHQVLSVDWSPTGDLLAVGCAAGRVLGSGDTWIDIPGKVQLRDAQTLEVVNELMTVRWSSVRFAPDGKRLIGAVKRYNTLAIAPEFAVWSTNAPPVEEQPKVEVAMLPATYSLPLPGAAPTRLTVSPSGQRVAAPLPDRECVGIWNLKTGEREVTGEGCKQIREIAFSPDESVVAAVSFDKTGTVWDARTGESLAKLEGHEDKLDYVTFSSQGEYVLTSTGKNWPYDKPGNVSARIWDTKAWKLVAELPAHSDTIKSARFSRDDTRVLTASDDHTVRLWEVATGKELFVLQHESQVVSLDFGPDDKTILTSSAAVPSRYAKRVRKRPQPAMRLWDAATGKLLLDKPYPHLVRAAFNESGDEILTECRGLIEYWSVASGEKLATLREPHVGSDVIFGPTGKHFVVLTKNGPAELWSVAERKRIGDLDIGSKEFDSGFSADGHTFHTVKRWGEFRAWSLDELQ